MKPEFVLPDWTSPLNVESRRALVPAHATAKGLVFDGLLQEAKRQNRLPKKTKSYIGFKDYPLLEFLSLQVELASSIYPHTTLREGLRRLGQASYPALFRSMIGRVVFGALGRKIESLVKMAPRGYAVTGNTGKVHVVETGENYTLLRFEDFYGFLDSYHIGVIEGAVSVCGKKGEVRFRELSAVDGEIYCSWF